MLNLINLDSINPNVYHFFILFLTFYEFFLKNHQNNYRYCHFFSFFYPSIEIDPFSFPFLHYYDGDDDDASSFSSPSTHFKSH